MAKKSAAPPPPPVPQTVPEYVAHLRAILLAESAHPSRNHRFSGPAASDSLRIRQSVIAHFEAQLSAIETARTGLNISVPGYETRQQPTTIDGINDKLKAEASGYETAVTQATATARTAREQRRRAEARRYDSLNIRKQVMQGMSERQANAEKDITRARRARDYAKELVAKMVPPPPPPVDKGKRTRRRTADNNGPRG